MSDNNNKRPQGDEKVLPMDRYRRPADEGTGATEKSVHQLLDHMRQVRSTVPVNHQLQEQLRQKLINYQAEMAGGGGESINVSPQHKEIRGGISRFAWLGLALMVLLVILVIWQSSSKGTLQPVGSPREVTRLWSADPNISMTVSTMGDVLVARHGQLIFIEKLSPQYRVLDLPQEWLYHSPAYSPDDSSVALVRQRQGGYPQIVVISASELIGSITTNQYQTLVVGDDGVQYTDLIWSPGGNKLAYTEIGSKGSASVWVIEGDNDPQKITAGSNPTWSPDGSKLVVQRPALNNDESYLFMINLNDGQEVMMGPGEQPVWGANEYLAFVSTRQQERVLTFMVDGSPQFTVRQRVGEIRSIYAGQSGKEILTMLEDNQNWLASSTLIVSPDGGGSGREMEWLRQMEIEGVREPRVLLLDAVDRCQNPVFGPQGTMLMFMRQEGTAVALMRVDLEKRLTNRGEK